MGFYFEIFTCITSILAYLLGIQIKMNVYKLVSKVALQTEVLLIFMHDYVGEEYYGDQDYPFE